MSDVNIGSKSVSFVELNQKIETQISKVNSSAGSPNISQVVDESKVVIAGILDDMLFALSDSELKQHPVSNDEAVKTLELLQKIETAAKGEIDGTRKVVLAEIKTKLNGLLTENIQHLAKTTTVNQPMKDALSAQGKVVGPVMDSSKISTGLVAGLDEIEESREIIPEKFAIDFSAPTYSKIAVAFNWVKNLFSSIFGGKVVDLTKEELKQRVREFGELNGRMLWEMKESVAFDKTLSDIFRNSMADPNCAIPADEREDLINEFVAIIKETQAEWLNDAYGDINGTKLSDIPIDTEIGRLVHYDLMSMVVAYVMQGKITDPACKELLSVENLTALPIEYKLAAKSRVLFKLEEICASGAYGSDPLNNPELANMMSVIAITELVDAINIQKSAQKGEIIAEPDKLETDEERVQFIISQVSKKISDPNKFIEVLGQMGIDNVLLMGSTDEPGKNRDGVERRHTIQQQNMQRVFKAMTPRQVLNFNEGLHSGNLRLLRRSVHIPNYPGRNIKTVIAEQRQQMIREELVGLENAFVDYARTDEFNEQLKELMEANQDDALLLNKVMNLQSFCKNKEVKEDGSKVDPAVVRQFDAALKEDSHRELNKKVSSMTSQLIWLVNDREKNQRAILKSLMAEISALNDSFRANKMEMTEREEFADMLVEMLMDSIKRHQYEHLLDKLAFLMIQDEFGPNFSKAIEDTFGEEIITEKDDSHFDQLVATKLVRTITAISQVRN